MTKNVILDKSYVFALETIKVYKYLVREKKEFVLSKQLLRSGTSIGANINEAQAGFSKKDFVAKMSISSKEARETKYWINLLSDSHYINSEKRDFLLGGINEIIAILTSIVKTGQGKD